MCFSEVKPSQIVVKVLGSNPIEAPEPLLESAVECVNVLDVVDSALDSLSARACQYYVLQIPILGEGLKSGCLIGAEGGNFRQSRAEQLFGLLPAELPPASDTGAGMALAVTGDQNASLPVADATLLGRAAAAPCLTR